MQLDYSYHMSVIGLLKRKEKKPDGPILIFGDRPFDVTISITDCPPELNNVVYDFLVKVKQVAEKENEMSEGEKDA
jgi:hypothetical protein